MLADMSVLAYTYVEYILDFTPAVLQRTTGLCIYVARPLLSAHCSVCVGDVWVVVRRFVASGWKRV